MFGDYLQLSVVAERSGVPSMAQSPIPVKGDGWTDTTGSHHSLPSTFSFGLLASDMHPTRLFTMGHQIIHIVVVLLGTSSGAFRLLVFVLHC